MGIERFFSSIQSNSITNRCGETISRKRLDVDNIFFDFNSEIHSVSSSVITRLNDNILQAIKSKEKIPSYTEEFIETSIIWELKNKIISNIKTFTISDKIKNILIAIDGVPTMGKIIEQRRRRYLSYIIEKMKKELYEKYKKTIDKSRQKFYKNKVSFNKTKISPGTEFMYKLQKELNSHFFINRLKKEFNNLKVYTLSGYNEYGEGEMKIFWKANNNTVIVSPDSDMTLLALIISTKYNNIKILRYNQQKKEYNTINIDLLKNRLMEYMKTKNNKNIIDLVILFTFFGNDFIPKVHSINVKSGFKQLLDVYNSSFKKHGFLINKKQISIKCLLSILKKLSILEKQNLQENYIDKNYKNYKYLKSILGEEDFVDKLKIFLNDLKKFNKGKVKNFDTENFIKKLRKLVKTEDNYKSNIHFINSYREHKNKKGYYPYINIILSKYSDKINKKFNNKYEEEIYKLENMKGEYKNILKSYDIDLGNIYIDPKTYDIKEEKIENSAKKYYKNFNKKDSIKQFLTGIVFTFRHYILSKKFIPIIWYYPYSKSPLISDIYNFIKNNPDYINNISLDISSNYFNSIQHLVYISPVEKLKPKEFRTNNSDEIINKLKENINCSGQIYLSKCFIDTKHKNPEKFIKKTSKIKKSADTLRLIGTYNTNNTVCIPNVVQMKDLKK